MTFKKKINYNTGVYIEAEVTSSSKQKIKKFIKELNNDLKKKFNKSFNIDDKTISEAHVTLIYSKKPFKGEIEFPFPKINSKAIGFKKFDNEKEDIYALVLELDCPKCKDLHRYLMKKYKFIFDYDQYIPHLTISYKARDITQEMLNEIKKEYIKKNKFPKIDFDKINIEPLDKNWANDKK